MLGGRAMEICYDQSQLERFVTEAFIVAQGQPVLIDRFLEDAIEVDVDAISDGETDDRGRHHGAHRRGGRALGRFSACVIPPYSLPGPVVAGDSRGHARLGPAAARRGLMNIQYAIKQEDGMPTLYVLEVNPRASRTVPFVSKATGVPVAKVGRQGDGRRERWPSRA